MAFFRHPTFKRTDPAQWKPELVAIKDEMVRGMGQKPNIFLCEWRANEEGETTTFWMPGAMHISESSTGSESGTRLTGGVGRSLAHL